MMNEPVRFLVDVPSRYKKGDVGTLISFVGGPTITAIVRIDKKYVRAAPEHIEHI